jgi:hypothetical protein
MADEIDTEVEKVKRYLQWATLLVMVAVAVTCIDLMIKNGILRAVKEADGRITKAVPNGSPDSSGNYPSDYVGSSSGASENGRTDATVRVSRTPPPEDSEKNESSSNELRVDSGPTDG